MVKAPVYTFSAATLVLYFGVVPRASKGATKAQQHPQLKLVCAARRQQLVRRVGTVGSVVAVQWHSRLNQIFMGTGMHPTGVTNTSLIHW